MKSTGKLVAPQCCGSDMMDDRCGSRCVRMCYVCQGCVRVCRDVPKVKGWERIGNEGYVGQ